MSELSKADLQKSVASLEEELGKVKEELEAATQLNEASAQTIARMEEQLKRDPAKAILDALKKLDKKVEAQGQAFVEALGAVGRSAGMSPMLSPQDSEVLTEARNTVVGGVYQGSDGSWHDANGDYVDPPEGFNEESVA